MNDNRKVHFDSIVKSTQEINQDTSEGIWQLPDSILDDVYGGASFTQNGGGYLSFAQNFSCFAQNIGNFSQWV